MTPQGCRELDAAVQAFPGGDPAKALVESADLVRIGVRLTELVRAYVCLASEDE